MLSRVTYMKQQRLPQAQLALLSQDQVYADEEAWQAALQRLGITAARHIQIATEGALVGSLVHHGLRAELVIISDDAGQFKIAGFLHALCWVHAERTIHKLIAGTDVNRAAQAAVREQIWTFYHDLKAYQRAPMSPPSGPWPSALMRSSPRRPNFKCSTWRLSVCMTTKPSYCSC